MVSEDGPEAQGLARGAAALTVQGRRRSAIGGLLAFVLLCIAFGPELARGEDSAGLLVLLALMLPTAWVNLKAVLAPSRIVVSGDQFCIRHRAVVLRCPASNVDQLFLEEGKLKILFADPDAVEPESSRPWLWRNFAKTSVHFEIPGRLFTREQLGQVRRALGKSAEDPREMDSAVEQFHHTLSRLCPRTIATPALVAINTVVFLALVFSGTDPLEPQIQDLLDWGANYGPETLAGEWWRGLTATFLHFGAIHLLFNMWVLWDVGRLVERVAGFWGFVVVYASSGALGSTASLIWRPTAVAAGASGAIFGLFGFLIGFLIRDRGSIPVRALKGLRASAVCFVLSNVAFGFLLPRIDMAGHLGGLLCGLLCGLAMSRPLTLEAAGNTRLCNVKGAVAAIALLALTVSFLPQAPLDVLGEVRQIQQTNEHLFARYWEVLEAAAGLKVPPNETARAIEGELLPGFREAHLRLSRLEREDPQLSDGLRSWARSMQRVIGDLDRMLAETKYAASLSDLEKEMLQLHEAYGDALNRAGSQKITEAAFAEIVEKELRPRYRSIQETTSRLKPAESGKASPAFLSLLKYHEELPAAWDRLIAGIEGRRALKENASDLQDMTERYQKASGEHEGGKISDEEFGKIIEGELLPRCRAAMERAARTKPADSAQAESFRKLGKLARDLETSLRQEAERLRAKPKEKRD